MAVKYSNNAVSTLLTAIGTTDTELTVFTDEGALFPEVASTDSDYFSITVVKSSGALEIMNVTDRAGDVFTVTRAQEDTTALEFDINDIVELRLTAGDIDALLNQVYASDEETQTGTESNKAVTPAGLSARTATESRTGIAALATQAEVDLGTDTEKIVTPATLAGKTASEDDAGIVQLATETEAKEGLVELKAVSPLQLAAVLDSLAGNDIVARSASMIALDSATNADDQIGFIQQYGFVTDSTTSTGVYNDGVYTGTLTYSDNLATNTANASASSSYSSYLPARAFDGDTNTDWLLGTTEAGQERGWLMYTFDAPTVVSKIMLRNSPSGTTAEVFNLEAYVDDDWKTIKRIELASQAANYETTVVLPFQYVASTKWRLRLIAATSSSYVRISLFEMYSVSAATNFQCVSPTREFDDDLSGRKVSGVITTIPFEDIDVDPDDEDDDDIEFYISPDVGTTWVQLDLYDNGESEDHRHFYWFSDVFPEIESTTYSWKFVSSNSKIVGLSKVQLVLDPIFDDED